MTVTFQKPPTVQSALALLFENGWVKSYTIQATHDTLATLYLELEHPADKELVDTVMMLAGDKSH